MVERGRPAERPSAGFSATRGTTLDKLIDEGGLSVEDALVLGDRLCDALDALHLCDDVHGGVSPEVVWVPDRGGFAEATLLEHDSAGGPGPSSPPEAFDGVPATEATDVYGLCLTIYTALAGDNPFRGGSAEEVALLVRKMPPSSLRDLGADMSSCSSVEDMILRGLRKDPKERPLLALVGSAFASKAVRGGGSASAGGGLSRPGTKPASVAIGAAQQSMPPESRATGSSVPSFSPSGPGNRRTASAPPPVPGLGAKRASAAPPPPGLGAKRASAAPPSPGLGAKRASAAPPSPGLGANRASAAPPSPGLGAKRESAAPPPPVLGAKVASAPPTAPSALGRRTKSSVPPPASATLDRARKSSVPPPSAAALARTFESPPPSLLPEDGWDEALKDPPPQPKASSPTKSKPGVTPKPEDSGDVRPAARKPKGEEGAPPSEGLLVVESGKPPPATGVTEEFMTEGVMMEEEAAEDEAAQREHAKARLRFALLILAIFLLGTLAYVGATWNR